MKDWGRYDGSNRNGDGSNVSSPNNSRLQTSRPRCSQCFKHLHAPSSSRTVLEYDGPALRMIASLGNLSVRKIAPPYVTLCNITTSAHDVSACVPPPAITRTTELFAHLTRHQRRSCGSLKPQWRLSAWKGPRWPASLGPWGFHVKADPSHSVDRSGLAVLEKRGPTCALGCVDQKRDMVRWAHGM